MATGKTIEIVLKARDDASKTFAAANTELGKLAALRQKIGAQKDLLGARDGIKSEITAQQEAYARATADATRYAKAMNDVGGQSRRTAAESRELRDAFALARDRARDAKVAIDDQAAALSRLRGAASGAGAGFLNASRQWQTALAAQGAAATSAAAGVTKLGAALAPIAPLQQKAGAASMVFTGHLIKQTGALNNLGAAMSGAYATRSGRGPLGLRPYELQNLSYQINDVVTGLASGQRPAQVFAQQIGQIVQLFPAFGAKLFSILPALAGFGALLTPVVANLMAMRSEATNLRTFNAQLTLMADGGRYSAEQLNEAVKELVRFGIGANEARAAVSQFVSEGLDPGKMVSFTRAAQKLADATGTDLPEAAEKMSSAFGGSVDDVRELDKELNFLTAAQYETIRALEDNGEQTEALEVAYTALETKLNMIATQAETRWSVAFDNLSGAWSNFLGWIGSTAPFQAATNAVLGLISVATTLMNLLPGGGMGGAVGQNTGMEAPIDDVLALSSDGDLQAAIDEADAQLVELRAAAVPSDSLIKQIEGERAAALAKLKLGPQDRLLPGSAALAGSSGSITPEVSPAEASALKARLDAARKQQAAVDDLNESMAFQASLIGKTAEEIAVDTAVREAQSKAVAEGELLTRKQIDTISANARALAQKEAAQEAAEESAKAAAKADKEAGEAAAKRAKEIADLNAEFGNSIEQQQFEAEISKLSERDQSIRIEVRKQELAFQKLGLTLETDRRIQIEQTTGALFDATEAEKARNKAASGGGKKGGKTEAEKADLEKRKKLEGELNNLLELRSALMAQIEFHQERGEQAIADGLNEELLNTREATEAAIKALQAYWSQFNTSEANAALANLNTVQAGLDTIAENAVVSGEEINEMLADGATDGIIEFVESMSAGENAIKSLANAFKAFAADFLLEIAQMIIRQTILNALQSAMGGGGPNGGVGGVIAGAINAMVLHDGGQVATAGSRRSVNAALFANAQRLHGGGIPGLRAGEVPAILENTEEVLTADDPRHSANGGRGGSKTKIVNVFSPADALDNALADESGQQVMLNYIKKNGRAIRGILDR